MEHLMTFPVLLTFIFIAAMTIAFVRVNMRDK